MKLTDSEVTGKASVVRSWVEDACGDMASTPLDWLDEKWRARARAMKQEGVVDVRGAIADAMYDDIDTLCDLTGDRIFDEGSGDWGDMIKIAMAIRMDSNESMRKAMTTHITRWRVNGRMKNDDYCLILDSIDTYTMCTFGVTLTQATDREWCIICGSRAANAIRNNDYWTTGCCNSCHTKLHETK